MESMYLVCKFLGLSGIESHRHEYDSKIEPKSMFSHMTAANLMYDSKIEKHVFPNDCSKPDV